jgi:pimeloyl-ACP methyl ester carboxylesterase
MPRQHINGVELYYELTGAGDPLVLVHGAFTDHTSWRFVVPGLAESYRVLSYDRRGHSRSERPAAPGGRRTDEDDLVALIETLELAPVHLVGSSHGSSIALSVAARRPELVRGVAVHEPPLLGIAEPGTMLGRMADTVLATMRAVAAEIGRGDAEGATARFIEEIALGPGMWRTLPVESRRALVANAPTFVDLLDDHDWAAVPLPAGAEPPILVTDGDSSPPWFGAIIAELFLTRYGQASRHTFRGAGHAPHLTHPAALVPVIRSFVESTYADAATTSGVQS